MKWPKDIDKTITPEETTPGKVYAEGIATNRQSAAQTVDRNDLK